VRLAPAFPQPWLPAVVCFSIWGRPSQRVRQRRNSRYSDSSIGAFNLSIGWAPIALDCAFDVWTEARAWPARHELFLADLRVAGQLDLDRCAVDGSHVHAHLASFPLSRVSLAVLYRHNRETPSPLP
jgi:hypothetical protein